jgi:metal-responsive CopG/Arc/MetJ family transcriptional regulator
MFCNMKTIAIAIEEDMLDRIDRLVAERGYAAGNRSRVVRMAIKEYLSRIERAAKEREKQIFKQHRSRLARQAAALVKEQAKL